MSAPARFLDPRSTIYDFTREIWVTCSACGACARLLCLEGTFGPRRLVCTCGYTKDWRGRCGFAVDQRGAFRVADVRFPLWLSVGCAGETLWAFNREHLDLIRSFVSATLRERIRDNESGWQNRSLVNRLPTWIRSAKRRDDVLRGIQKLEAKLELAQHAFATR